MLKKAKKDFDNGKYQWVLGSRANAQRYCLEGAYLLQIAPCSLNEHQKVFDKWRKDFNKARPHEAPEMKVPSDIYTKSEIKYSAENVEIRYKSDYKVRIINDRGFINLKQKRVFVGNSFAGYYAGIKNLLISRQKCCTASVL
jgi:hypothetical protein